MAHNNPVILEAPDDIPSCYIARRRIQKRPAEYAVLGAGTTHVAAPVLIHSGRQSVRSFGAGCVAMRCRRAPLG